MRSELMYVCIYVCMDGSMYLCMDLCMYVFNFPDMQYLLGTIKISDFWLLVILLYLIKIEEDPETLLFLWSWGIPLPIIHILWGKVCHYILKQINHFPWRHEVYPLNYFLVQNWNPISMWLYECEIKHFA